MLETCCSCGDCRAYISVAFSCGPAITVSSNTSNDIILSESAPFYLHRHLADLADTITEAKTSEDILNSLDALVGPFVNQGEEQPAAPATAAPTSSTPTTAAAAAAVSPSSTNVGAHHSNKDARKFRAPTTLPTRRTWTKADAGIPYGEGVLCICCVYMWSAANVCKQARVVLCRELCQGSLSAPHRCTCIRLMLHKVLCCYKQPYSRCALIETTVV